MNPTRRYEHLRLEFIFFFQAEDGIRDGHVTGVQTCALPICGVALPRPLEGGLPGEQRVQRGRQGEEVAAHIDRSEERRVGKECRSRWSQEQEKKRRPTYLWVVVIDKHD